MPGFFNAFRFENGELVQFDEIINRSNHAPAPTPEPDPLNLPGNTVRARFKAGYTPTMGDKQTQVDAARNIWDITDNSGNWTAMFWNEDDGEDKVLEVLGINISSDYVPGKEYEIKSVVNHDGQRYILLYADSGNYPHKTLTDTDWVPEHWTPLSINDWCVLNEYTAIISAHYPSENSFRFVFYGTTVDPSALNSKGVWEKVVEGTNFCTLWEYYIEYESDQRAAFKNALTSDIGTCFILNFPASDYSPSYAEMFYGCTAIKGIIDCPNFEITDATDGHSMFENCTNLKHICNSFITFASQDKPLSINSLFKGCTQLTNIGGNMVQIPNVYFVTSYDDYVTDDYDSVFENCVNVQTGLADWGIIYTNLYTDIASQSLGDVDWTRASNAFTNCGTATEYGRTQRQYVSSTFGGDGPRLQPNP